MKSTLIAKSFVTGHVTNIPCPFVSRVLNIFHISLTLYSFLRSRSKFLMWNRPHYEGGGISHCFLWPTTCNCPRYDNNLSKHLLLQIVLTNEVKIRKVEGNKKEYEK